MALRVRRTIFTHASETDGEFRIVFLRQIAYGILDPVHAPSQINIGFGAFRTQRIYVGPDQNVYFFSNYGTNQTLYGARVRHQIVATPDSIDLNLFDNASIEFFVTEPINGGAPWTVRSLDPSIATVTPASSLVGRFHVNEVHAGSTTLVVTDALGNVSYLPVTAI